MLLQLKNRTDAKLFGPRTASVFFFSFSFRINLKKEKHSKQKKTKKNYFFFKKGTF